jgi:membrane fusion protein (multidrug efflux system)
MSLRNRFIMTAFLCVGIVSTGAAMAYGLATYRQKQKEAELAALKPEEVVPNVKVQVLKSQRVEDAVLVTGAIEPWDDRVVSAEVSGIMEWRGVEEGDAVAEDQDIARIDTDTIKAQLDESVAQEKWAKQEFERAKGLVAKGAVGQRDVQQAQAQLDIAQSSMRVRSILLTKSVVKAPIGGVVDKLFAKKDEYIDAGKAIARIVQTQHVKAHVGIPERDITRFKVGDAVRLKADAIPDREFEGVIHRIGISADPSTRTFMTEIEIQNADQTLRPGMIVRASLVRQAFPESLLIPMFSVISLENQRLVFVENDGVVDTRLVETGVLVGSSVQITKGLIPGDRLVIVGQRELRPGTKVTVREVLQ